MFPLTTNPRTVSEADFPAGGTPAEQLRFLLNYAVLAPSEYNIQPWLFRVLDREVELYIDHSRRLPVVDPEDRETIISCSAACLNLRIALRHFGYQEEAVIRQHSKPASYYKRPDFEAGIVFPQWSADGYGANWQQQLPTIQDQTGARWIEVTIFLDQATDNSTQVRTNASSPTVQSFADSVSAARAAGYHVFVVPLMGVDSPAEQWAGTISFSNYQDEAQWFDTYWQTLQPYAAAAAKAGAEQMAIGTELVSLQQSAPAALWNTLIARIHSVFPGTLTYDMNWSSLGQPLASWLKNPQLAMIGVSEYTPLVNERLRVEPKQIFGLWKTIVKSALDSASLQLGKPLVISEIGYRNSADTLYHSWLPYSTVSPPDPAEQAAACDAALANVIPDPHIIGIFFWGWDDVQGFKLSGQPAASVLNRWYSSPQS